MGFRKMRLNSISFSVVFLLVFSQITNITDSFLKIEKPLEVNTASYSCYDFLIANKEMYVLLSRWLDILDISEPSKPIDATINETLIPSYPYTITKDENTILFASGDYPNTSLEVIELDEVKTKKTVNLDCYIRKIVLKDEMLYSMAWNEETKVFTIHNATDIENIQLLGSTNTSYFYGYYLQKPIPDYYFIHENNCLFITEEGNLALYQINNSYQITFIKEYSFTDLRNLFFAEKYLFTCDKTGLQLYNYMNIENLSLVKQYNTPNARSVQVRDEIAYLITERQFLTLDLSNIEDIKMLDQYVLGKREPIDLMKIELKEDLAVVIIEKKDSGAAGYMGYLYIFDASTPSKIKRIYPERIPLNPYGFWVIAFDIFMIYVAPPIIIAIVFITIFVIVKERKRRKEKISNKKSDEKFQRR